jgi:hypothetical protein
VHVPLPETHWAVGSELTWNTFVNTSADWTQVADNGQNKGIVFIIQSKTGRHLGKYARCVQNNPVIFAPGSRFLITAYHKFHATALGQANIRESTFPATDADFEKAKEGRRNIIVALTEV